MKKKSLTFKITITIAFIFLALLVAGTVFVFSKLGKLNYHDGTVTEEVAEEVVEEDVAQEVAPEEESTEEAAEEVVLISDEEAEELGEAEVILSDAELIFDKDVFNILLLGTDERTSKFSTNARADSIMLLSLNKKDNTMKLVSLQRGMGVPVLEGQYKDQYDWITHIFRYGGADLMLKTVREMFNVDVDYYVRVNFNTFEQLVDSVGGVDITLDAEEAAHLNATRKTPGRLYSEVVAGANHLDGANSLRYSRLRKIDSDWQRVQRQRNVIQAVVSSTGDMNLLELSNMLDEVLPLIQTNLTTTDILGLVSYAPAVLGKDIEQMTIPVKGTYGSMRGMGNRNLYAVNFQRNSEILQEFLYGAEE